MDTPPSTVTYLAIGRAVFAAQLFEMCLVPIAEMHRLHVEPGRIEQTGGFLPAGAFKLPTSRLIQQLSALGTVDTDLEARINAYLDRRHTLVHRWVLEKGLPTTEQDDSDLAALAHCVEREAKSLAQLLVGYVVKYGEPEWAAANPAEYASRMQNLFKDAHLDGSE